ncbi:MAG: hypothetical protein JWO37_2417 [Acidimicrobiales bacterium]|jgi:uncharacterized membrane-anchored protein YhcB (DUF1043 family)|nr:hypothetical protein [Acidimicrobiales bacterium]
MADVQKTLKDAAYVAVGLGVIGFQKAQVRRRELTKQVEDQLKTAESQLSTQRKRVEEQVAVGAEQLEKLTKQFQQRIDPVLDSIEEKLPEAARGLVKQARTAAHSAQDQLIARARTTTNGAQAAA